MHQAAMYAEALRSYTLNRKLLSVKAKIDNPPPDLSPMDLIDVLSNDLASINNGTESSQRYRTSDIVSKIIQNNSYEAVRQRPRGIKT
ncbi:hypothetical protein RZS08_50635, partial [Arthrospira platensis SPKY1]|nr:hypothetical protein [Arthrospira platensis SPKY1]